MNDMFANQLDKSVVVFLDDILVFSDNLDDHMVHLREVFTCLRSRPFYAKLTKCEFLLKEIKFLGYIISEHGVHVNPAKVDTIVNYGQP